MTWFNEIKNTSHALACLDHWFPQANNKPEYAKLVTFLSGGAPYFGAFEKTMEYLSKKLWLEFLQIESGSNRLTRAIQHMGGRYGFKSYMNNVGVDHRVYIGQLSKEHFLNNVGERLLWKDSFGFGHGEFTHSFQWLAAGMFFGWGSFTGELYQGTVATSSREMFVLGGGKISKETEVPLWQWLVDCVRPRDGNAPEGFNALHYELCGACFTGPGYRYANNVQSLLESHPEWFLGAYVKQRIQKIDQLTEGHKKHLVSEHGSLNKAKKSLGVETLSSGDIQRLALEKKYKGSVEGEVAQKLKLDGPAKNTGALTFHGISADPPAAPARHIVLNGRVVTI